MIDKIYKISYLNSLVPFFLVYTKVLNIRCWIETLRTIKKQFFRKNYTRTKNCEFSNYNFENFLRFADFLLGHWSTKKITNFQKILKKPHTGELHKKGTILHQAPQITLFFDSPYMLKISKVYSIRLYRFKY